MISIKNTTYNAIYFSEMYIDNDSINQTVVLENNFNNKLYKNKHPQICFLCVSQPDESLSLNRSSLSEVFLRKCVLKICSKFTGEHSFVEVRFQ